MFDDYAGVVVERLSVDECALDVGDAVDALVKEARRLVGDAVDDNDENLAAEQETFVPSLPKNVRFFANDSQARTSEAVRFRFAATLARQLCDRMYDEHGFTVSIGVAPSKLLAKAQLRGRATPQTIVVLPPQQTSAFLDQQTLGTMPGVRKRIAVDNFVRGADTPLAALRRCSLLQLAALGDLDPSAALWLHNVVLHGGIGNDDAAVAPRAPPTQLIAQMNLRPSSNAVRMRAGALECLANVIDDIDRRLLLVECDARAPRRARELKLEMRLVDGVVPPATFAMSAFYDARGVRSRDKMLEPNDWRQRSARPSTTPPLLCDLFVCVWASLCLWRALVICCRFSNRTRRQKRRKDDC